MRKGMDTVKVKDKDALKHELSNCEKVGKELFEQGEKYRKDVETIEKEMERVKNSGLSETDKKNFLGALEISKELTQVEYQEKVEKPQEEVQDYMQLNLDETQEQIGELEATEECLNEMTMEGMEKERTLGAMMTDVQSQKQAFETMKTEYLEKLNLQMEQAKIQKQNIFKKQLSGR